ncbi:MAG: Serine/threonine-protein kinase PknD [Myxococcota bacterium]|nr:Serine/threonine-protein kinase PknD [Myxococcota bacterium]
MDITCIRCQHPNPGGSAFCARCGAALPVESWGFSPSPESSMRAPPPAGPSQVTLADQHPANVDFHPGEIFDGRYEIRDQLGQGGMGVVYSAFDRVRNIPVALKLMQPALTQNPRARERFIREVTLTQDLRHPNIVRVHDLGHANTGREPLLYFTMDLVEGQSLRRLLDSRQGAPLQAGEIAGFLQGICQALAFAHGRGVIHRDLSPDNIIIRNDGQVVLTDFGVARALADGGAPLTREGAAMGKPQYAAPEQLQSGGKADHRADIYSAGVILYELCTGGLPVGTSPDSITHRRPDLPRNFQDVFERATKGAMFLRYDSVAAFYEALTGRKLENPAQPAARPVPPPAAPGESKPFFTPPVQPQSPYPQQPPTQSVEPGVRPGGGDQIQCARCGLLFTSNQMVSLAGKTYCYNCKTVATHEIQAGIGEGSGIELATIGRRSGAIFMDGAVVVIPSIILLSMMGLDWFSDNPRAYIVGFIPFVYEGAFLHMRGQTLGKMATGLKVVKANGSDIEPWQAWVRAGVRMFLNFFCAGIPNYIVAFVTSERTALHDLAARTRVIVIRK